MKANDMIKVHLYSNNTEIYTRNFDKIFKVYEKNGQLGIDWNTGHSPYTCRGEVFNPLSTFASTVLFENIETGALYRWNCIRNDIEKLDVMTIQEAYAWIKNNTTLMEDTAMLDFECLTYCIRHRLLQAVDKEHFIAR